MKRFCLTSLVLLISVDFLKICTLFTIVMLECLGENIKKSYLSINNFDFCSCDLSLVLGGLFIA